MTTSSTKYFCFKDTNSQSSYTSGYTTLSTNLSTILTALLSNFDVTTQPSPNDKLINLADTNSLDLKNNTVVKALCSSYNTQYQNFMTIPVPSTISQCCTNGTTVASTITDQNGNITVTCACASGTSPYYDNKSGSLLCNAGYGCAASSIETRPTGSLNSAYNNQLVCDCTTSDSNWGNKSKKCYNTTTNVQTPLNTAGTNITGLTANYVTSSNPIGSITMVGDVPYANFSDGSNCYLDAARTFTPTLCSSRKCNESTKACCAATDSNIACKSA